MRLYAVCPGGGDPSGAEEVHRVVEVADQLAYEATPVHFDVSGVSAAPPCPVASPGRGASDFPDAADTLVLVRNEDVLDVLDVSLGKVAVWWVEVVDFPVLLGRLAQEMGWGPSVSSVIHGPAFTHVVASDAALQYVSGHGSAATALDARAGDAELRQQVFELVEQQRTKHLAATQWVK